MLKHTPLHLNVKGKSGKEYSFWIYNIDDDISPSEKGVFIFTIIRNDMRRGLPVASHIFIKFDGILRNNEEAILKAKEKGAECFCLLSSNSPDQIKEVIEDIQQGKDFQYQLITFPDLVQAP